MSIFTPICQFLFRFRHRLFAWISGLILISVFLLPAPGTAQVTDSASQSTDSTGRENDSANSSDGTRENDSAFHEATSFREVPDSALKIYKHNRDFAYANDSSYWREETDNNDSRFGTMLFRWLGSPWTRGIVYLLLSGVLLFALYRIVVENKLYLFYSSSKKTKAVKTGDAEEIDENLEEKIDRAEQAMEFRLATRYRYLKALRMLADKGLIRMRAQATDTEYLSQLAGSRQEDGFTWLTRAYEYVWYGGFGLSAAQFTEVKKYFEEFYNTLHY